MHENDFCFFSIFKIIIYINHTHTRTHGKAKTGIPNRRDQMIKNWKSDMRWPVSNCVFIGVRLLVKQIWIIWKFSSKIWISEDMFLEKKIHFCQRERERSQSNGGHIDLFYLSAQLLEKILIPTMAKAGSNRSWELGARNWKPAVTRGVKRRESNSWNILPPPRVCIEGKLRFRARFRTGKQRFSSIAPCQISPCEDKLWIVRE